MSEPSDLQRLLQHLAAGAEPARTPTPAIADAKSSVFGFTYNVGVGATFALGYVVQGNVVSLLTTIQAGGQSQPWLWCDVPRSAALDQAAQMVAEVKRYAAKISPLVRSTEALSLDDFQEHLRLRLEGGFN